MNSSANTYTIYQQITELSGGMLYVVTNANAMKLLPAIFVIFGNEALNSEIILDYEKRSKPTPNTTYTVRVSVDSGLTTLMAIWTGCSLGKDVRDNRGASLNLLIIIQTKVICSVYCYRRVVKYNTAYKLLAYC